MQAGFTGRSLSNDSGGGGISVVVIGLASGMSGRAGISTFSHSSAGARPLRDASSGKMGSLKQ